MTKTIIWRLKEQPSSESLRELVKDGILTKEEAREILFSSQTEEDRDKKSLESEIKFLRELVEKLSNRSSTRIVEVIKEVEVPWRRWDWYRPYQIWCSGTTDLTTTSEAVVYTNNMSNFSDIKTF